MRVVTFLAFVHIFIAGEASESSVLISGTPHHDYAGPCMIDPSRKLGSKSDALIFIYPVRSDLTGQGGCTVN